MKVTINGEPREIVGARNVAELLEELGLPGTAMLVEHNGVALRREEWAGCAVVEGDRCELLRISAGG